MDSETKKLDSRILEFIKKYDCSRPEEGAFEALALRIFRYQLKRNPNYRKFCLLEGTTPNKITSWKKIPAMPTQGFKELVLATFPIKDSVKVFRTSGTTRGRASATGVSAPAYRSDRDAPLRGSHFFDTLKLYKAAIVPPFREYLLIDGGEFRFYFLTQSPAEAPDSSLSYMMGVVNRVFAKRKGRFYVRKNEILNEALISDLKSSKKKVFLLSVAFSLKSFLEYLKKKKTVLRLSKGSRLMETGGFKGKMREVSKKSLYQECEKRLGIPQDHCVSEYGMTELSSQFYDTTLRDKIKKIRQKPFKIGPAWARTLVIDPKTGREAKKGHIGILRHFDLANRGSVLVIQTEDLGRQVGDGFEVLGRASGAELRGCSLSYEEFLRQ